MMRDSTFTTPDAARPRFGAGAFRGTIAPASAGVLDAAKVTAPATKVGPVTGIRPVYVTEFSEPSKLRLGAMRMLAEWWRWRRPMSGEIFVGPSGSKIAAVGYSRQMAAPHVLGAVVANRRVVYDPPEYGSGEMLSGAVVSSRRRIRR